MVRVTSAAKAGASSAVGGGSDQKERKKSVTVQLHTSSDKGRGTPTCSGCDAVIGENVKALQCDLCSSNNYWKCIDCLDIRPPLCDALIDGQAKELRWFCKSCDASVMQYSEKLDEIMKALQLLTTKSECIEAALVDKADKTVLDSVSDKLAGVEKSVDKLTQCNVELKEELTKSVEGIEHSDAKLGDSFQCKIEEKVGSLETTVAKQEDIKRRKNNVVLHGLQEPEGADADSRYAADNDRIMELFHEMGCDDVSVDSIKEKLKTW